MQQRKQNIIDKLRNDWKGHIILGSHLVNPLVFIGMMLIFQFVLPTDYTLFNINLNSAIVGARLSIVACAICHWGIELYQKYTNSGKKEVSDAIAGTSSAINYYLVLEIFNQIQ